MIANLPLLLGAYVLIGSLAGFAAGLLGVGGGLIVVPALTWLFVLQGIPEAVRVHVAVGTSLAVITVAASASAYHHYRAGHLDPTWLRRLAPGVVVGGFGGILLAKALPGVALAAVVGLYQWFVAVRMGRRTESDEIPDPPPHVSHSDPDRERGGKTGAKTTLAAMAMGAISTLTGIGGGTLTVPYQVRRGVPLHRAIPVGAACAVPIGLVGALGFVVLGWNQLPAGNMGGTYAGFIHLPSALLIAVSSLWSARIGVRTAHRWHATRLRRVFAGVLAVTGTSMLAGLLGWGG